MLVERLLSDKTDLDLLRSCAVALGRIASIEDVEVVDALGRAAARVGDEQTRRFAVMALAEIGRRDPDPAAHPEQQRALQQRFVRELQHARPITGVPWGAIALGVWARNPRVDKALLAEAQGKLTDELTNLSNPSHRAATAVALGLADAKESRGQLLDLFEDEKNQVLKSYVAIGLGLMDARDAAEPLRAAMAAKGLDPTLRLQVARALGLLGDRQAVAALVENLKQADTLGETSATAQSLGLIGDREAVDPLLAILGDVRQPALRRGFAAVGLGLLAEKGELPWNTPFTIGANYRAKTPALAEIFDIL
ncbi:MAG: HEAT repeat domain-containing protein [Planctomycetes bacterium]|nr:HEAT repeat domain-containing protein [Planctomycetota bacterium]